MKTHTIREFVNANFQSPMISGEWLGEDFKPVNGPPSTWKYLCYELRDGRKFYLPKEEVNKQHDFEVKV